MQQADSKSSGPLAPGMMAAPSANSSTSTPGGAASLAPAIREQTDKLAEKSRDAGIEAADAVGKAVASAADTLQESIPALAGYVRNAASYTNKFADNLRDQKAEDLIASAVSFGRKQPLMVVAGAALLGFTLARLVKSGVVGTAVAASQTGNADGTDRGRGPGAGEGADEGANEGGAP